MWEVIPLYAHAHYMIFLYALWYGKCPRSLGVISWTLLHSGESPKQNKKRAHKTLVMMTLKIHFVTSELLDSAILRASKVLSLLYLNHSLQEIMGFTDWTDLD